MKTGMIIGRDLYGHDNELMLAKGVVLSPVEINRIKALKYQGVYIADAESENLAMDTGISDHLRNKAVKTLKQVFKQVEMDRDSLTKTDVLEGAMSVTRDIVQEISVNRNVSVNMIDLKMFDDYTYYHSVNVSVISVILGYAMGLSKNDLYKLGSARCYMTSARSLFRKSISTSRQSSRRRSLKRLKHTAGRAAITSGNTGIYRLCPMSPY